VALLLGAFVTVGVALHIFPSDILKRNLEAFLDAALRKDGEWNSYEPAYEDGRRSR
jgi:hypothetical protein